MKLNCKRKVKAKKNFETAATLDTDMRLINNRKKDF